MKLKRTIAAILLAAMTFAAPSCRRIPLYDLDGNIYVDLQIDLNIDVELSPDIKIDGNPELEAKVYGKMPEHVQVCFFDSKTHEIVTDTFLPASGGPVTVPAGTYDIIVYSLGTESTLISKGKRGDYYAYTSDITASMKSVMTKIQDSLKSKTKADDDDEEKNPTFGNDPIINEPDHVFVEMLEGVEIPAVEDIKESQTIVIRAEARPLLETYSFEVVNVVGAQNIAEADVFITGQAGTKHLWNLVPGTKPHTIYFNAVADKEKGHIYTVFNTFGKIPGQTSDVYLNVLIKDGQGGETLFVFDVTDQFDNPDNTKHEIIINEEIVVPEKGGSGGFEPSVDPWDPTVDDIEL